MKNEFDAIVIGGGPGGSTAASFIAMQGHKVLLLEKESFPRHQVGESLLPATIHGVCSLLGVAEELKNAGYPRKRGGTFSWGKDPTPWTFTFAKNTDAPGGYAYQVERSKFDQLLLENSKKKGVDVRENHQVEEIIFRGDRAVGVNYVDSQGVHQSAAGKYIIDAGGNRLQSYNAKTRDRIYSDFFQNIAVYGYYENGKRLPPPNDGNILCVAFSGGWFWYIPLSATLTSVGAVVDRKIAAPIRYDRGSALENFINDCPLIREYLLGANRVKDGQYGEVRVRQDFSYCNTTFTKPGLLMVGDAACFVDPVFSSGVHLATYAALLAARSVNTCLKQTISEQYCFKEYENRYRREYGNIYQFLVSFYDMHQDLDSYYWSARKVLDTEERGNDAFIRLVAGRSSLQEPIFADDFFNDRLGIGDWMHRNIASVPDGIPVDGYKHDSSFDHSKFDPAKFMGGFNAEIAQVQLQAMFGTDRPKETPIFSGGLSVSRDGLHWTV